MKQLALTLIAITFLVVPSLAQYTFTSVDYPGATKTVLYAVNDRGQFVGAFFDKRAARHVSMASNSKRSIRMA